MQYNILNIEQYTAYNIEQYNILNIKVIQDTRREVECYVFSENEIGDVSNMVASHHDVYDMFLCPKPLLVVPEKKDSTPTRRGEGYVSLTSKLIRPELLNPPYDIYLLNSNAMELLEGESIPEKLANLDEFHNKESEKELLINFIYYLSEKGLYTVVSCS